MRAVGLPMLTAGLLLIGAVVVAERNGLIPIEPATVVRSDRDPMPAGNIRDLESLGAVSVRDGIFQVERSMVRLGEDHSPLTISASVSVPLGGLDTLVAASSGSSSLQGQDAWSLTVFCAARARCAEEVWDLPEGLRERQVAVVSLGTVSGREQARRAVATLSEMIAAAGGVSVLEAKKPVRYHERLHRAVTFP